MGVTQAGYDTCPLGVDYPGVWRPQCHDLLVLTNGRESITSNRKILCLGHSRIHGRDASTPDDETYISVLSS